MPRRRARISNEELEFLENTAAYALSIIQHLKALIYWLDDPDQLRIASLIIADAQAIRQTTIERMKRRKQERKQPLASASGSAKGADPPAR